MYKKHYQFFEGWIEPQELYDELYIYVLCTGNLQKNYEFLKTSLVNHVKHILQYRINRYKYNVCSLNEPVYYTKYGKETDDLELLSTVTNINNMETFDQYYDTDLDTDNIQLLQTVLSIKEKTVRNVLIATAYLVANITCFRSAYLDLLKELNTKSKQKLDKLYERTKVRDDGKRVKGIGVKDILRALNVKEFLDDKPRTAVQTISDALEELKFYLSNSNIF